MLKISFAKRTSLLCSVAGLMVFATPAHAQLEQALSIAQSSTAQSAASQERIVNADDRAGSMILEYRAIQQQIDNIQLFVDQQDIYLKSQNAEIASLNKQLGTIDATKQSLSPMMLRMAVHLEDFVEQDVPFLKADRLQRIQRVKDVLGDPGIDPAEQYRQVLNAYKIEVAYGQGLDSYEGVHPSDSGKIVNYLRYGRTALVFMTKDESEIARFNMDTRTWDALPGSMALEVRQAIRVAKGESAPRMVSAPVIAGQGVN